MIVELVSFRTLETVDDSEFLSRAAAIEPFLERREGYRCRRLLKCDGGLWLDYVEWDSMEFAENAMKQMESAPEVGPFMSAIDPESISVKHHFAALIQG